MVESNLNILLKNLNPRIVDGRYHFASVDPGQIMTLANYLGYITAIFREDEGLTVVFLEDILSDMSQITDKTVGPFSLITLHVQSDLMSIGLLAKLTNELAKNNISVNAYSAYYHDHLFVPYDLRENALAILTKINHS